MKERIKLKILHWFFPNKCVSCRKVISFDGLFCKECESKLIRPSGKRCKICFATKEKCNCLKEPKFYFRATSPFIYKDSAKNAILKLKFIKHKRLADFFAANMKAVMDKKFKDVKFDAIFPVPLHKSRINQRGFNQSLVLANSLSKLINVPVIDNKLLRVKKGKNQHTLKFKERKENVKGLYKASNISINCQRVLLIDDIMTSGATLNECAKILRLEGVPKIYCITAAKVE